MSNDKSSWAGKASDYTGLEAKLAIEGLKLPEASRVVWPSLETYVAANLREIQLGLRSEPGAKEA